MIPSSREECEALDEASPFARTRELFDLPNGVIYLDGNSLGPLPKVVTSRLSRVVEEEWGQSLITSWNRHGWFDLPRKVGDRIGRLIGSVPGSVVAIDTLSVALYRLLGAALTLRPNRRTILTDTGNFPNDLYIAQGLTRFLGQGHEVRIVEPDAVASAFSPDTAVVMLTEVDYRTGRRHDMADLTARAHAAGALTIWDLAHSAGAFPVDLQGVNADFAVGCAYKYLNGGPGAPAFLYVRPDLQDEVRPPITGWWGHAEPFEFSLDFKPAHGITRMQCGTQPILSLSALDAALDVWDGVDMTALRRESEALQALFIDHAEKLCARHHLRLAGPRDMSMRGSQVSFHVSEAYAVMQALIAEGVIGDFRAPDLIRFGLTPLYTRFSDVWDAAATLANILDERRWDRPEFRIRKPVT